jgi:hypothetical protein
VLSGPVCVAGPGAGGVIRGAPEEGGSFARRIRHSVSHPSRFSSESCAVVATTEASTIIHVTRTRRDSEAGNGKSAGLSHVIGCYRAVRSVLEPPHSLSSFLFLPHSINVFMAQVIVVGGGLAGLSAAHTLLERGANVLLLDKQGSVSVFLCLFPLFLNLPSLPSASWVEIPRKLHPASTVLALRLSKISALQTPQRFSLTTPSTQCVFSSLDYSFSTEVPVLYGIGS